MPAAGGTACRAKETLSWKMCRPITLLQRGGGESASKNGQGAAEGAAAVSWDGSLSPVPAPVTRGGRSDAERKPPQVAELQLRPGRPRNAGYFY